MQELEEIKELLDEKYSLYNTSKFISLDPISIPHLFSKKEDIEIAGFFDCHHLVGKQEIHYFERYTINGENGSCAIGLYTKSSKKRFNRL